MSKIFYKDLKPELLYEFFPEYKDTILKIASELGDDLPHALFGNFFNPLIKNILKNCTNTNMALANKIFAFYEKLAASNDEEVRNLLQVTLLEYLWDDYDVYLVANKCMGINTKKINEEIKKYLYPPVQ